LKEEVARGIERHAAASTAMAEASDDLKAGKAISGDKIEDTVEGFMEMVSLDLDLLPMIAAMQTSKDEYLFDHCINVSLMSMSLACQLGMNQEQIKEIGLGALLQDIGMLEVPDEIRFAARSLSSMEWVEIKRHPIYTLNYLEKVKGIDLPVRLIGYQAHERLDGSGYPCRRSGMLIHQFTKIVSVADAYMAMTSARPHRSAMLPYEAVRTILVQGSKDRFDRAVVRALLDSVSLFPIGSLVELSDGQVDIVIRAVPNSHTRPVVELVNAEKQRTGEVVDLSERTDLKVTRPLATEGIDISMPETQVESS